MHRKGVGLLAAGSGHNADRSTAPITAARWSDSEQRDGASASLVTRHHGRWAELAAGNHAAAGRSDTPVGVRDHVGRHNEPALDELLARVDHETIAIAIWDHVAQVPELTCRPGTGT